MELTVKTLEGKDAGTIALSDAVFGLEPREDILARVVRWQLAKKQQGTHKSKGRAEVSRTGSKMYKQKGTGRARHHSARAPQFRGGGKAHGPVVRSHAFDLPKKVRALGLRLALSAKLRSESLIVVDDLVVFGYQRRLFGDRRGYDHIVVAKIRHLNRSSRASTAALESTSLPRRRMS